MRGTEGRTTGFRRAAVVLFAVFALVLAACGGSGGDGRGGDAPAGEPNAPAYVGPVEAPGGQAFYQPPDPLPAGRPGDILWSRTVTESADLDRLGVTVHQVLYRSDDALGEPIAVSGIVYLPADARTPIVGYGPGTRGLADECATSRILIAPARTARTPTATTPEAPVVATPTVTSTVTAPTATAPADIRAVLSAGWAVAVTDYEGLGTPGEHTYAVGRSEGHAVLDAVRAAIRLPGSGLSAQAPVAVMGYSQGGGAAVWAGEQAASYAPELDLVAVVGGGVPADLAVVANTLDGSLYAGFALAAASGLDAAYPELDLAAYLTAHGRAEIAAAQTECSAGLVANHVGQTIDEFTTTDPLATPEWQTRLEENRLGADPDSVPEVPILLYHAMSDSVVPYSQAEELRNRYCAAGASVTWRSFPGDHRDGDEQAAEVRAFVADRFAGRPAPGNC